MHFREDILRTFEIHHADGSIQHIHFLGRVPLTFQKFDFFGKPYCK